MEGKMVATGAYTPQNNSSRDRLILAVQRNISQDNSVDAVYVVGIQGELTPLRTDLYSFFNSAMSTGKNVFRTVGIVSIPGSSRVTNAIALRKVLTAFYRTCSLVPLQWALNVDKVRDGKGGALINFKAIRTRWGKLSCFSCRHVDDQWLLFFIVKGEREKKWVNGDVDSEENGVEGEFKELQVPMDDVANTLSSNHSSSSLASPASHSVPVVQVLATLENPPKARRAAESNRKARGKGRALPSADLPIQQTPALLIQETESVCMVAANLLNVARDASENTWEHHLSP